MAKRHMKRERERERDLVKKSINILRKTQMNFCVNPINTHTDRQIHTQTDRHTHTYTHTHTHTHTHIYIYKLNHFAVHLKLKQHCKSTTFQ